MDNRDRLYGAVEAGGTKFICAVGADFERLRSVTSIPTTSPEETLDRVAQFFSQCTDQHGPLEAVGIGSFGPVCLRRQSPAYGHILDTPKRGWQRVDIAGTVSRALGVRVEVDTDVNCALLGEARWGAGRGLSDLVYLTIGTGVGGGVMVDGRVAYGFAHPEIGHMLVPKLPEDEGFAGSCPFHGDRCLEGLASGPALAARGIGHSWPADHPIWAMEARYLACACVNLLLTSAPARIVLGGGVMRQLQLFPLIREQVRELLNGYADFESPLDPGSIIVPAALGEQSGIAGALVRAANPSG